MKAADTTAVLRAASVGDISTLPCPLPSVDTPPKPPSYAAPRPPQPAPYRNSHLPSARAATGTLKLSSPANRGGRSSTAAQAADTAATLPAASAGDTASTPKRWNQAIMAMEAMKEDDANATLPSTLLLPPSCHLCRPICRPTRSARPSPTASYIQKKTVVDKGFVEVWEGRGVEDGDYFLRGRRGVAHGQL